MRLLKQIFGATLIATLLVAGIAFATSETLKYDNNDRPVTGAVSNDANMEVRNLRVDPTTNALLTTDTVTATGLTAYFDGRKEVTTAGTAVALNATTKPFNWCLVQAEESNTGDIMIGASTVDETPATARGNRLLPGGSIGLPAGDLLYIYADSEISTDGVTYFCQN